jgi:hypothetical protein
MEVPVAPQFADGLSSPCCFNCCLASTRQVDYHRKRNFCAISSGIVKGVEKLISWLLAADHEKRVVYQQKR